MVVVGVDAHKRSHTLVAVDGNGKVLGQVTVHATSVGHLEAVKWVGKFGGERMWAIEDCRNLSHRFESELLAARDGDPGANQDDGRYPQECPGVGQVGSDRRGGGLSGILCMWVASPSTLSAYRSGRRKSEVTEGSETTASR